MALHRQSLVRWLLTVLLLGFAFGSAVSAQAPRLEVWIPDTSVFPDNQSLQFDLHLANYQDSVAAFQITLTNTRPDLITFSGSVDTSGTLISGWEVVDAFTSGVDGERFTMIGIADVPYPTTITPAIGYPQSGDVPLVRFTVDAAVTAGLTADDLALCFSYSPATDLLISNASGYGIGLTTEVFTDTTFWLCLLWAGEECVSWSKVDTPPFDSLSVTTEERTIVDSLQVHANDAHLRVGTCGDVGNLDGTVNLSDITALVDYVYLDGPAPPSLWAANVDGSPDGTINLGDITHMLDFVYLGGSGLDCQ